MCLCKTAREREREREEDPTSAVCGSLLCAELTKRREKRSVASFAVCAWLRVEKLDGEGEGEEGGR